MYIIDDNDDIDDNDTYYQYLKRQYKLATHMEEVLDEDR